MSVVLNQELFFEKDGKSKKKKNYVVTGQSLSFFKLDQRDFSKVISLTLTITQDQGGQGSEQLCLVKDTSTYCRGLDWITFITSNPNYSVIWFKLFKNHFGDF